MDAGRCLHGGERAYEPGTTTVVVIAVVNSRRFIIDGVGVPYVMFDFGERRAERERAKINWDAPKSERKYQRSPP